MTTSPEPAYVHFDDAEMWVELDGRTLGIRHAWFPASSTAPPRSAKPSN